MQNYEKISLVWSNEGKMYPTWSHIMQHWPWTLWNQNVSNSSTEKMARTWAAVEQGFNISFKISNTDELERFKIFTSHFRSQWMTRQRGLTNVQYFWTALTAFSSDRVHYWQDAKYRNAPTPYRALSDAISGPDSAVVLVVLSQRVQVIEWHFLRAEIYARG